MNFRILLVFFLVSMSDLSHAMYGARPVSGTRLDGVVSLVFDDPENVEYNGSFCQGVLVSPTKILTAAHCIEFVSRTVDPNEDPLWLASNTHLVKIKIGGTTVSPSSIKLAPNYFEESGFSGVDLAIIELPHAVKNVKPFRILGKADLKVGMKISLVAKKKMADTTLTAVKKYPETSLLITDGRTAGLTLGDSGGAMLTEIKGEYFLTGILLFDGEEDQKKAAIGHFPQTSFR